MNLVSQDREIDQLLVAGASDRDSHRRPSGATQLPYGLVAGPALGVLALDSRDHVTATETFLVCRRPLEDGEHGDPAINHLDGNTQAVIPAFLPLAHLRVAAGVHEAGVRVQRLQHPGNGTVDEAVRLDLADVTGLDCPKRGREHPVLVGNLVLGDQRAPAVKASQQGAKHDRKRCR